MKRTSVRPRDGWQKLLEEQGMTFHSTPARYWHESAAVQITACECEELQKASETLHHLCLEAVAHVIDKRLFDRFSFSPEACDLIVASWKRGDKGLYGRFDLRYDGTEAPKLLEYNADTPTSLLEASIIQRSWRDARFPGVAQGNRLHEALVARWLEIVPTGATIHFSTLDHLAEDVATTQYIRMCASSAGFRTRYVPIEKVAWESTSQSFYDHTGERIEFWFKLYPWEWIFEDPFGAYMLRSPCRVFEPAWKALLTNKAILPILWNLFPDHPNLLPTYYEPGHCGGPYVRKPILGREGANVSIHLRDKTLVAFGPYGNQPSIYQQFSPLPRIDGEHILFGGWMIGDDFGGLGVRESNGLISENTSRFTPLLVSDGDVVEESDEKNQRIAA